VGTATKQNEGVQRFILERWSSLDHWEWTYFRFWSSYFWNSFILHWIL